MSVDRVLLLGMMGAGKTTVGRALSSLLGWRYLDNDELLRRAVGRDTRSVLEQDGVRALRRAESAALDVGLREGGPLIAAVAAGVVTDPRDAERLRRCGYVVWLRADLATLVARVSGTDRPWVTRAPSRAMSALYAGRAAVYAGVADLVIDVDSLPADQVARRIVTGMAEFDRGEHRRRVRAQSG